LAFHHVVLDLDLDHIGSDASPGLEHPSESTAIRLVMSMSGGSTSTEHGDRGPAVYVLQGFVLLAFVYRSCTDARIHSPGRKHQTRIVLYDTIPNYAALAQPGGPRV
jgi:hypothetical protein